VKSPISHHFPVILIIPLIFLTSCGSEPQPTQSTRNISMMDDSLLNYNKVVVKTEDQEIEDFIQRYGWKMAKSSTGLRYMIYRHGSGDRAEKGKKVRIMYEVRLINGNLCYSSVEKGPKEFIIGHGGIEAGAEEGILLMRVGDRAKFIVPSHLAFGLLGDQDKIPPKSAIIYDIELIKIN
jgi:FKBP-type peptidyl-prolyl cis-trans isomerase FkpA